MNFEFNVKNSESLTKLFEQLSLFEQNSLVKQSLNEASKPILDQAKSNFLSRLKGDSYDSGKFSRSFVSSKMKNKVGMIVGIDNYVYRWVEWGTKIRLTGGKTRGNTFKPKRSKNGKKVVVASRGIMPANHFFFDAVKSQQEQSAEILSQGIINSMEKILQNNPK